MDSFSTLFELLPIGAYRSLPDGTQVRANSALVKLNGYGSEAEMLAGVKDIGVDWYVQPDRREQFKQLMERDGAVRGFVSEIYRHKTRERIWISENAHVVRDGPGQVRYYEGTVEDITAARHARQALERSEAEQRQFAAQMPAMAYRGRFNDDGTREYLSVSAGVHLLYGVAPEEVIADPGLLMRLRHPDDADPTATAKEALLAGAPLVSEFRICPRGGGVRWVQVRSHAIARDERGWLRSGVMIDVTEHKLAQLKLLQQAEVWKTALDSVGDGAWDWNVQTDQESLSDRCYEMYGYQRETFEGTAADLDRLTHPDDVAQMQRDREAHFKGESAIYSNEHRIRCADGRWKWVLSRGLVIERDEQGQPLRMIGTHTDVTGRHEAEALRRQRDQAAAADRAKTALLSRVSHELRTPLNAVLGFGQLLQNDDGLSARHQTQVAHVLDAGRHLLQLVDDLLDLAAAEDRQLKLAPQALRLEDKVLTAWKMLTPLHEKRHIALRGLDAVHSLPPVWADAQRLTQVLNNVLSNAIKFSPIGAEVQLQASATTDAVWLQIRDQGPGFSAEQLERAFRPFERLGAERSGVQGTGLGLSLTREFMRAMGGEVQLHSQAGQGSCFALRLPLAPVA